MESKKKSWTAKRIVVCILLSPLIIAGGLVVAPCLLIADVIVGVSYLADIAFNSAKGE